MAVVLLTGASGFLGIHILERLLKEGHQVRAFVRSPAKLRENLALLGVDPDDPRIDVVAGDMTDAAAAREASSGCDQAIHAAATFSYRRRDAERMRRENKVGTTTVLDAAIEAGCTGIVHVSSTAALLRPGATVPCLIGRSTATWGIDPIMSCQAQHVSIHQPQNAVFRTAHSRGTLSNRF